MAKVIRIGVIGCGFYAENHLQSWQHLARQGAQLVAVCDLDLAKAQKAGTDYRVPHFTDPARMMAEIGLDAVDIVTRHETHRSLCEMSIANGLAVIVQKPFATSLADAFAIVTAAEKAGTWLAVHENFRFQAPMRQVTKVLASGALGSPSWARIAFRTGFDVYRTQPYFLHEKQLAIADVGIHVLDLARAFLGEVTRISCEIQTRKAGIAGEDTATMLLRHEGGAVSVVECTYASHRDPDPFPETLIEIEGPKGTLQVHPGCRMTVTTVDGSQTSDIGAPLLPWTAHPWHVSQEGAYAACAHFLDCLQSGVSAATSGQDNLKTFALVDAAYRAADSHRAEAPAHWPPG
jgi:D-apiose dehydrogenase